MKSYLRTFLTRQTVEQVVKVGLVGIFNTAVSFAIYNAMLSLLDATGPGATTAALFWSVAISFAIATLFSYFLNRRWTFQLSGGGASRREAVQFYLINLGALGLTSLFVTGANAVWGPLSRLGANIAYLAAAAVILIPKFAGYRDVVFRQALGEDITEERTPIEVADRPGSAGV